MRNSTDTRGRKENKRRINHAFRLLSSLREAVEAVLGEGEESDGGCERAEKVLSRLRAIAIGKDVDFSFDDAAEVSPTQKGKVIFVRKRSFHSRIFWLCSTPPTWPPRNPLWTGRRRWRYSNA